MSMKLRNNRVSGQEVIDAYYDFVEARLNLYGQFWNFWLNAMTPYQLDSVYHAAREAMKKGGGFWPHYGE